MSNWPTVRLETLATFKNGLNFPGTSWGRGTKIIGVSDFGSRMFPDYETLDEVDPRGVVRDVDLLAENDILFVRSNGNRELIGRSMLIRGLHEPVSHSGFTIRLRFRDGVQVIPRFYAYLFKSDLIRKTLSGSGGGTNINNLNQGLLGQLEVPVPPLDEQEGIAAFLACYDDLIANNQRRIALLESMAEEIYREWFVRMRCPVDTEANRSPDRLRPFDSLCELQRGFDLPDSDMQPGVVPVIASTSIKGFHNVAKVQPPVITTGRSGSLGTVLYVREPAWPLNTSLWVKDFKGNSPNLVYFTLRGLHLENFNAGAGVPTLNRNHLKSIKVRIPTADSQAKFDELIEPILAQAQTLRLACAKLVSTRDALLPRLISGKLRVDALDIQFPPSMQQPPAEAAQPGAFS